MTFEDFRNWWSILGPVAIGAVAWVAAEWSRRWDADREDRRFVERSRIEWERRTDDARREQMKADHARRRDQAAEFVKKARGLLSGASRDSFPDSIPVVEAAAELQLSACTEELRSAAESLEVSARKASLVGAMIRKEGKSQVAVDELARCIDAYQADLEAFISVARSDLNAELDQIYGRPGETP